MPPFGINHTAAVCCILIFLSVLCLFEFVLSAVFDVVGHGLDFACLLECPACEQRTDELVNKNCKKHDVAGEVAFFAKLHSRCAHTQRNACLRQKRDTEVLTNLRLALNELCAAQSAEVFAE